MRPYGSYGSLWARMGHMGLYANTHLNSNRLVRMVRLLPELKSLVCLIMASMSSFVWTCVLLMLLVYMLAVYMTMMAATNGPICIHEGPI